MDPLSAFFMACWFAYLLVLDKVDPKGADRRHAERMQRMQHGHEKWMARRRERQAMWEQGHSTIGRALQNRAARWVENAGRRVDNADEAIREAERRDAQAGRTPGLLRASWRQARMAAALWWRAKAERVQERLSDRFDEELPFQDSTGPEVKIVADDEPSEQSTQEGAGAQPYGDSTTEPGTSGSGGQQRQSCCECGYGGVRHALGDGRYLCHNCWLRKYYQAGGGAGSSAGSAGPSAPPPPPPPADDQSGAPKYYPSERADAPKELEAGATAGEPSDDIVDAEVVDDTQDPTTPDGGGEAPSSNGNSNHQGEPSMSEPVQTLTLNSGETISPETGIAFAEGLNAIYTEMGSRIQASIANLSQAGVAQDQIAKFTEMLNLNAAAQAKAAEMSQHFTDHKGTAEHAAATGAGTNAGYLGNH